jgi:pyruvate dehydrogenase E2 component (dihydrolipoamide acetyltransferase)
MPALSPTMEVGTITSWSKSEGDSFSAGSTLCTIETDKASVDFEAQDDGFIAKIIRQGENAVDMPIGTPICVIVQDEAHVAAFGDFTVDVLTQLETESGVSTSDQPILSAPAVSVLGPSILFPSARHLSESSGLDATGLSGSGKGGRVTKGDVINAMQAGMLPPLTTHTSTIPAHTAPLPVTAVKSSPVPIGASTAPRTDWKLPVIETHGTFEDVTNNKMRKIIAKRLTESKSQVPHFYTAVQVELDSILALRKKLANDHQVKVSVNDFVIRCCALALRDVPEVNGKYSNDGGTLSLSDSIDISVAVATPTGLITPIVFNTARLGLAEISATVQDLASRARDGKLQPHEYQGGTFSVSNLGMFGIHEFSAVINPPQAAILAVGGGERRVVATTVFDENQHKSGIPKMKPSAAIRTIMTASLSADRRVVDEATAALFMSVFCQYMNRPELLLL